MSSLSAPSRSSSSRTRSRRSSRRASPFFAYSHRVPAIRTSMKSLQDHGLDLFHPKASRRPILPGPASHHLGDAGENIGKIHKLVHANVRHQLFQGTRGDAQHSSVITTATYSAHPRLAREDASFTPGFSSREQLEEQLFGLNRIAAGIAHDVRSSLNGDHIVLGSFGTSGESHAAVGHLEGSEGQLIQAYRKDHLAQLQGLSTGRKPVDALFFEAAGVSIPELIAVAQLCKSLSVPLLISCVVNDAGKLLDPRNNDGFQQIDRTVRRILGKLFLGLSINCSPRAAIMNAFEQDEYGVLRGAHQNEGEYTDAELAEGNFGKAQSIADDMIWKTPLYQERPDLSYEGRCCSAGKNDRKYSQAARDRFERKAA